MISAAEARELAGPTAQEQVDAIEPLIREAAENKKRSVRLHGKFWAHEGYEKTAKYKEASEILKDLDYKVSFFYEELQFVNMYTIVEW